jgi:hypothetical protein
LQGKKGDTMKLGYSEYIPKGRLERFNKNSVFLKNVREVIREALIMKEKGILTLKKLKKIFPQRKWKYDPFKNIRLTVFIKPEEYVIIQDILEEHTGKLWTMDKFLRYLIIKFIKEYENKPMKEDEKNLIKSKVLFEKYFKNIMGSWKE